MLYIKNDEELLSHGNVELRRAAIDIIDHGIKNADPYVQVKKLVHVDGRTLHVGNDSFDLNHYTRIYVLGAGKATFPMMCLASLLLTALLSANTVRRESLSTSGCIIPAIQYRMKTDMRRARS